MSTRRISGFLVLDLGLAAFCWGLFHLIRTGTCASGGAFVIARECPDGTGWNVVALMVGLVVVLAGGVAAGLGMAVAPLIFMAVGGTSIAAANLGDVPEGMGAFPYAFGVPFLVIGALWFLAAVGVKRWLRRPPDPTEEGAPDRQKTPLFGARGAPVNAPPPDPLTPAVDTAWDPASQPPPVAAIDLEPAEKPVAIQRLEQLERLAALERSGAITSAEYERLKRDILTQ